MTNYWKIAAAALTTILSADAYAACERMQRSVAYDGRPVDVRVAKGQFTEVIFPEQLVAVLPEKVQGMSYHENAFPDRLFFAVDDSAYRGIVILQGQSGSSYHVRLNGAACGDLTVRIDERSIEPLRPPPATAQRAGKKLIEYMLLGETPPAYSRSKVDVPMPERLVLEQGSVKFYIDEIYKGLNYTGIVLLAVNEGRVPYRVALEAIDFSTPELREVLGRVTEITMFPYDFRLSPAPEFAADAAHATHQGLVFIVSEARRHASW